MFDPLQAHGLQSSSLLCPWNSPSQNIGVGSCSLLQGIFPTQGSNPCLPYCRQFLYHLSPRGNLGGDIEFRVLPVHRDWDKTETLCFTETETETLYSKMYDDYILKWWWLHFKVITFRSLRERFLICRWFMYISEKAMVPHSSTLAWKISWTEEPDTLQSMGSLGVGHDWATSLSLLTFMHWRRKWQPTPVFLPRESQGRGSLVGCHLWGRTESDTTEAT